MWCNLHVALECGLASFAVLKYTEALSEVASIEPSASIPGAKQASSSIYQKYREKNITLQHHRTSQYTPLVDLARTLHQPIKTSCTKIYASLHTLSIKEEPARSAMYKKLDGVDFFVNERRPSIDCSHISL